VSVFTRFFGRRGPKSEAPAAPPVQNDHSTDSAEPQPTLDGCANLHPGRNCEIYISSDIVGAGGLLVE
jgi:hypothetical protein